MRAAKKLTVDKKLLQEFIPLNALSPGRFREVSEKIIIEEVLAGRYLFRKGDRDNQSIYLLEGKINLIDGFSKVTSEIEAGSDMSRHPLSNQQPRSLSARAVKKCIIARIDSGLLDVLLTWDQSNSAEVVEIGSDDNQDWMTRILQTEAFIKIPPAMIQSLLIKMQSYPVKAGDVVIRQGDVGDYFYTIHEGRCAVTRKESPDGDEQFLAELGDGTSFGEDALVSDVKRNASVTMLTDGLLMRLAKEDFLELLRDQLVQHVDYEQGAAMVEEGAVWVDVRTADEYEGGSFEDSVNMPLAGLRDEMSELAFNTKYIICCDTGRRSESAGFLLSHKGFDVYVLEGGIPGPAVDVVPADVSDDGAGSQPAGSIKTDQVIAEGDESLVALRSENEKLLAEIEEYRSAGVRANEQLELLRGELGESGEKLKALYAQAKTDSEQLEQLRGELGESGEKLGALYAQTDNDTGELQLLQEQYTALQTQHADMANAHKLELDELSKQSSELQSQLDAARDEGRVLEEGAASAQGARQEVQQLKDALKEAGERISVLESDVVKSDEAGTEQVNEAERRLQEQLERVQQLQDELSAAKQAMSDYQEQSSSHASEKEAALQQALDEQKEAAREQIENLESEKAEFENERSSHAELLELAARDKEQLQQAFDSVTEKKSGLESEVEALREQASALAAGSAAELQLLQEQLEAEQARAAGFEQSGSNKDVQLRDLQEEILQAGAARTGLEQEIDVLRRQHEEMQSQLVQHAGRTRELEQEHEESIRKAHDDLKRKNDNEKELQGQIDRLRKKLEQTTTDMKSSREGSQTDLDNLRDELHSERQARAEERAEMAARQRELKEQLSAIAVEHEANLTNHSGAIEQARDAGREEEQERLHHLLEAQSQSEEQVSALQQELQKAHEEIAELTRQEKGRRQVDMEMMQEQNQQAVSTITQLESQLQQLTLDRDAALDEQQALREKMNVLRGEVDAAKDLIKAGSQDQVEDSEKLRHELDETRKNMEIALRLRSEAEAACDQLIEERNALQEEQDEKAADGNTLHVPSLDAGDADSGYPEPQPPTLTVKEEPEEKSVGREKDFKLPPLVTFDDDTRQRRWTGAVIGIGVIGAVVLAATLLIRAGNPFSGVAEVVGMTAVDWFAGDTEESAAPVEADAAVETAAPAEESVAPAVKVQEKVAVVTPPEPAAAEPVPEPVPVKEVVPEPAPVRVAPIRTFQDAIKGGAKGPVMVELPAADYLMGSPGKSLNRDEGPRHKVTLPGFSISKHEVTFAEYDKFARATGRRLPKDESWGRGKRPVINVSWNDARAYTKWLSKKTGKKYRLPTEAEWEYAARAGNTGNMWWDSKSDIKQANCFNCGSKWDGKRTAPTGSFDANAFGLHDMAGNVQEWTEDCYHNSYAKAPDDGSAWVAPFCTKRVIRGGGYTSPLDILRHAKRSQYDEEVRLDNIGFRVVRSN